MSAEMPFGLRDVAVEWCAVEGNRLWLYGASGKWAIRSPASVGICRLSRHRESG